MTIINEQEIAGMPQNKESDIVLSVNGVSKKFCRDLKRSLMYGVRDITSELLGLREKSDKLREQEFWALNNVSFELRRGEALGLVGKNGSGKSTLLRIIAGLIKPDSGCVKVNGRVAPLIALGAGFNPILTGRENIYANMAILGLSKKEIDERFDEVIEFAEIGDAIDAPVQTYSSGMAARLGFATAIHTNPDILLIDEVLSVGDIRFQAKCQRALGSLRHKGTSFFMVSHKTQLILSTCENSVYLKKGRVISFGNSRTVMNEYEKDLFSVGVGLKSQLFFSPKKEDRKIGFELLYIILKDMNGKAIDSLVSGKSAKFCIGFKCYRQFKDLSCTIKIKQLGGEGADLIYISTKNSDFCFDVEDGSYELKLVIPTNILGPNVYTAFIRIFYDSIKTLKFVEDFTFEVSTNGLMGQSQYFQPHTWELELLKGNQ
ncbi:ABC transporter ATP-binding protein [Nostoc sp. CENA67]|uniref:ABC transporter ATP-binding protein n=1 Tax=Amazonocrinis nigriterrae CENA67 TaxID=2794033 RepID=A0A8J7HUK2_9NOST|nr:ABC transporter ATP-binding protein [Amazonocrinis nigriterrae]MBH8566037.1 ABC transporter ATP-binding protein [Amazonocrinis nigriterrae CENA67]